MTGTSLKSPMSGRWISADVLITLSLRTGQALGLAGSEHQAANVLQHMGEMARKPGRQSSIDHAVVIRDREWQHQARLEGLAIPDRRHSGADNPQDRNLGRVHERRERRAANSSEA